MKNPKSTRPSAATPYQTAEVTQETRVAETPTPWISHRVVTHCIDRAGGLMPLSSGELIEALKEGLPVQELDELQDRLNLPMDKLVPMLGISKATWHRRKNTGRLDMAESDRVVRFARLLGSAATVMESLENGRRWLTSPQIGLSGAVPLEYAETEIGAREVESLLGRIEYGVYS